MANKAKKKPVKAKRRRTRRRTTPKTTDIYKYIAPKSMQFGQFAEGWIPYMHKMTFEPIPVGTTNGLYSTQSYSGQTALQKQQPTLRDLQQKDSVPSGGQMDAETGPFLESSMEIDIARSTLLDIIDRNPQAFPSTFFSGTTPNNKMLQRFFKQLNKRNAENQLMEGDLIQWITDNMYTTNLK